MKRNSSTTAFYFETLLLIVVFLAVILLLTQVYGLARLRSAAAEQLTDAVTLAGNAAEAVSFSDGEEALLQLLNEKNNAERLGDHNGVAARYNTQLQPDPHGEYRVEVTWIPDESGTGGLIRSEIRVLHAETDGEIYRLETAAFKGADE